MDRFGEEAGKFASPQGTPAPMRALSPGALSRPFNTYEVIQPLTVKEGPVLPAYGQPGLGTQYLLPSSVESLIRSDVLRKVQ